MARLGMPPTPHKRLVGSRLNVALEALGLKQVQVCKTFKVSQSKLGNWLRGDNYPDARFLTEFCNRYNVSMDYLYRGRVSSAMDGTVADALWAAEQALQSAPEAAETRVP